jgi:hypothetical protein
MVNLKTAAVAATGVAVGVLTLRTIRQRRMEPKAEAKSSVESAIEEGTEALTHAVAAAGHARVAGEKGAEYARTELVTEPEPVSVESADRLGRVREGWKRRKP